MPRSRSTHRLSLDEFQFINHVRRRFGNTASSVARGIGDDAAVFTPRKGCQTVLTTDLLVEGVHFDLKTAPFEDIGYKSAAANLSDIAAMGASPDYALISLAVPSSLSRSDINRFYRGFMSACRRHGVQLIGGDTSASRRDLFVNITLVGSVATGHAITRQGARVGDLLYVTGTIGDSLAGLALLSGRTLNLPDSTRHYLIRRHLRPSPRLEVGLALSEHRLATSAIDVSDGLSGDLRHICLESEVGVEVDQSALPLSNQLRTYARVRAADAVDLALQGGEDYELLFTISPRNRQKLQEQAGRLIGRLSCIGIIRPQKFGLQLRDATGRMRRLPQLSYRHFQSSPSLQAFS
jgi:thiamine-monophosphate kinase